MNKNVYLFEIDSVRCTDEETRRALAALYDEIVVRANTVVLSFNQIVDSRAILGMLASNERLSVLVKLFDLGVLQISCHGENRTLSQYAQASIQKNLSGEPGESKFLFSGLPVTSSQKRLLKLLNDALVNSDLSEFDEYLRSQELPEGQGKQERHGSDADGEDRCNEFDSEKALAIANLFRGRAELLEQLPEGEEAAKKLQEHLHTLRILRRFVTLILAVSPQAENTLQSRWLSEGRAKSLSDYLDLVTKIIDNDPQLEEWKEAREILLELKDRWDNEGSRNDRSIWHDKLRIKSEGELEHDSLDALRRAECIIDICYNYTIESSIYSVSKHYRQDDDGNIDELSFANDARKRLEVYWDNGADADKRFLHEEESSWKDWPSNCIDWKLGLFIIEHRGKRKSPPQTSSEIPTYEHAYRKELREAKLRNVNSCLLGIAGVLVSFLVMLGIEWFINEAQDEAGGFFDNLAFVLLLFMAVSSVIDKLITSVWKEMPNVFDGLDTIFRLIRSLGHVLLRGDGRSYVNESNACSTQCSGIEALRQGKPEPVAPSSVKRYLELKDKRGDLFKPSSFLPLEIPEGNKLTQASDWALWAGRELGVAYQSNFHMMLVDLVRKPGADAPFFYERLVPSAQGEAVVLVVTCKERYVLLSQFRHSVRESMTAFPRGFGEDEGGKPLDAVENAKKELMEELGAEPVGDPVLLGTIAPDSGTTAMKAKVFQVEVASFEQKKDYEEIEGAFSASREEFLQMIKGGEITDGFTLAAFALAETRRSTGIGASANTA